jgi:hypothetical protein
MIGAVLGLRIRCLWRCAVLCWSELACAALRRLGPCCAVLCWAAPHGALLGYVPSYACWQRNLPNCMDLWGEGMLHLSPKGPMHRKGIYFGTWDGTVPHHNDNCFLYN